ncbi:MAG: hypothetical protein V4570_00205 [Pseudomonadota bacterium]
MNANKNLIELSLKFKNRIIKLRDEVNSEPRNIERYCIVSIALLNNFLRAYLLSIRIYAQDSTGTFQSYPTHYLTEAHLIDDFMRFGKVTRWKIGLVGTWLPKDEPAFHTPYIFIRIVNGLNPSNLGNILAAFTDSGKIDVLRALRNYFAHRCKSTEKEAIQMVLSKYSIPTSRAAGILLVHDSSIASSILDDINNYLLNFADNIIL